MRLTVAAGIAILVVFLLQATMWLLSLSRMTYSSQVKRANHYLYVFQTPQYGRGNVPNASIKPSGIAERTLIFLILAVLIAIVVLAIIYFVKSERESPFPAINGIILAYAILCFVVIVPCFTIASLQTRHQLFMRTLFNNALYNSLSDDPSFTSSITTSGPTAAINALNAAYAAAAAASASASAAASGSTPLTSNVASSSSSSTSFLRTLAASTASETTASNAVKQGAAQVSALGQALRNNTTTLLSRVKASVWAKLGPGFLRLYHGLRDFAYDIQRESILAPLTPDNPTDGWVSALITVNMYLHVVRNVPSDSPLYATVMAVFSPDDYTRRGVDYFSFFAYGTYNVVDNRAPAYRNLIPADIRDVVLHRVQQRMGIINGLAEKATGGTQSANDVYQHFVNAVFWTTTTPLVVTWILFVTMRFLLDVPLSDRQSWIRTLNYFMSRFRKN